MSEAVKTLTITECRHKKSGTTNGRDWSLYTVSAVDDTGLPVQQDLISFSQLPLGTNQYKVTTKPSRDPQYPPSYSLELADKSKAIPQPPSPADEGHEMLRESIRLLNDRVGALEAAVRGAGLFASTYAQTDVPVAQPPVQVGAANDTDDIPF